MPLYKYTGIDKQGNVVKDSFACKDENELVFELSKKGIKVNKFKKISEKRTSSFFSVSSRVSIKEFVSFSQQLSIMIRAGVTIADSLNTLRNQNFSIYFKNIISQVYEDVLSGVYLSDAFAKFPSVFPSFFCSMVYVGELSGNLSDVLVRAATYYQNEQKTKRKTSTALIYPTFLLIIVVALFFMLMVVVVPQFTDMIVSFDGEIPPITKAVQELSTFVVNNLGFILLVLAAVIILGILFFKKTKVGKKAKDNIKYYMIVVRSVTRNSIITRFCTGFSILLSSGLSVLDSLKAMPKVINNSVFDKQFSTVIKDVNDGKSLSLALSKCKVFPKMLIQMTSVGEKTSSLEEVYTTVGDYYNDVLQTSLSRAVGLIEPIVIVVLGAIVLVVILAVMLPMFSLMESIH